MITYGGNQPMQGLPPIGLATPKSFNAGMGMPNTGYSTQSYGL